MYNEDGTAQEPAFGSGVPGQSWLARATFGTVNRVLSPIIRALLIFEKRHIIS